MKSIFREEVLRSEMIAIADDNGKSMTYKELTEQAEILLKHIEERSLIFLLCDKSIETAEFLYAILYLNRVPLLLPADIKQDMLNNLITVYHPQYIFCDKQHDLVKRNSYEAKSEFSRHVLLETNFEKYPLHPDLALLLSTSGTTGSAKLVKLSYENLYDNAEYACSHLGIEKGQKGISPLPINYTLGLVFCFWHWHCGATLLVTEEPVIGKEFCNFVMREKANNFTGTPYTFQMLERVQFWKPEILDNLHFAMSAGTQMSDKDQLAFVSLMQDKFWIGYGQAECAGMISGMNFEKDNIKLGSVGKALRNMEIIIDDETSELCIKSKSVCMGYAGQMEDLSTGNTNQGFLHTGDMAYMDDDGCIFLKGRLARFMKILGKRTSLDEIERYIKNIFAGIEVACIGTDDNLTVFYTNSDEQLSEKIKNILALDLKIPGRFISCQSVEKMPMNDSGKIMYNQLKSLVS